MKTLFRLLDKKLEKSQIGLFQRGKSTILVKNLKFFLVFNLVKIGQENVFDDILERKKAFLQYKNTKLKKSKHWDFCKGLVHGLNRKFEKFPCSYCSQNKPTKGVWRISRKKVSLDYEKTTTTTTSLKFAFFLKKLAHDYGQESKNFPSLYFSQDRLV